eukprot:scaffold817_cov246-Pinguiococcus_pyrenoidosus.AAC.5
MTRHRYSFVATLRLGYRKNAKADAPPFCRMRLAKAGPELAAKKSANTALFGPSHIARPRP